MIGPPNESRRSSLPGRKSIGASLASKRFDGLKAVLRTIVQVAATKATTDAMTMMMMRVVLGMPAILLSDCEGSAVELADADEEDEVPEDVLERELTTDEAELLLLLLLEALVTVDSCTVSVVDWVVERSAALVSGCVVVSEVVSSVVTGALDVVETIAADVSSMTCGVDAVVVVVGTGALEVKSSTMEPKIPCEVVLAEATGVVLAAAAAEVSVLPLSATAEVEDAAAARMMLKGGPGAKGGGERSALAFRFEQVVSMTVPMQSVFLFGSLQQTVCDPAGAALAQEHNTFATRLRRSTVP